MFKSFSGTTSTHKHLVIAAIAISGLMMFGFAYTLQIQQANAEHRPISISRSIEIPCLPYCNIANEPQDREIIGTFHHIRLAFSFVPRG